MPRPCGPAAGLLLSDRSRLYRVTQCAFVRHPTLASAFPRGSAPCADVPGFGVLRFTFRTAFGWVPPQRTVTRVGPAFPFSSSRAGEDCLRPGSVRALVDAFSDRAANRALAGLRDGPGSTGACCSTGVGAETSPAFRNARSALEPRPVSYTHLRAHET